MNENEEPIYEQQKGESARHYAWFHTYMLLGPQREMLEAFNFFCASNSAQISPFGPKNEPFKRQKCLPGAWKEAAKKWNWSERASAWDKEQRQSARQRREAWDIEIEERLRQRLDKSLKQLDEADKVLEEMLKFPLVRRKSTVVSEDGKTVHVTIEPARWTFDTAIRACSAMSTSLKQSVDVYGKLSEMFRERMIMEDLEDWGNNMEVSDAITVLEAKGYHIIQPNEVVTLTPEQLRDNEQFRLQNLGAVYEAQIKAGDMSGLPKLQAISRQISTLQGLNLPAAKERPMPKKKKRDLSKYSENEKLIMAEILDPERHSEDDEMYK